LTAIRTVATALPLGVNRRSGSLVRLLAVVIWVVFMASPFLDRAAVALAG
jgi:hypothetical protein